MEGFRTVRDNYPHLLVNLEVFSQPAACVDSIIMTWMIQSQAAAFPSSLWLRDMLAEGNTPLVQQAATLSGQMMGHIQGGTNFYVQTTETDMSHCFKRDFDEARQKECRRCKYEAKAKSMPVPFECSALQILTIVHEAQANQMKRQERDQLVLRATRSNGWLSWRPNLKTGKFERAGDQPWASDMPEARANRHIPQHWFLERDQWLNSDGEPDMTALEGDTLEADHVAAQVEPEFCRWEGCMLDSSIVLDFDVLELGFKNHMANMHDWLPPRQLRTVKKGNLDDIHARCEQLCKQSKERWKRSMAAKTDKRRVVNASHHTPPHAMENAPMSVHKRRRLNPIGQKPVENKTGKKWWAMKLMKEKRNKPMKTKKKKTLTKRRKARKLKPKSVAAPVFNKGDMVLVVDERVGQTSYGKKAKVVSVTSTIAFLNFSPDGGSMYVPLNCLKANKFEPSKALKSITILKNMQKLNILKDMNCQGDAGDQVATSDQSGKQLLHQSLVAGWSLMKMLMPGCKPGKLEEYIYI